MSNEVVENPVEVVETKPNETILETPIENSYKVLGYRVSVISLQLGQYALLGINLSCTKKDEHYIVYKELMLDGDDYLAWGADDKYIMEFVASKLSTIY